MKGEAIARTAEFQSCLTRTTSHAYSQSSAGRISDRGSALQGCKKKLNKLLTCRSNPPRGPLQVPEFRAGITRRLTVLHQDLADTRK